jgi:hypothetical protein
MTSASEIIASTHISAVYRALTGVEPRRTGTGRWRAPATWRGGDGLTVSLNDLRGAWRDYKTQEHGGILDLIVRVIGGTRKEALRWCADLTGMPLGDEPLSTVHRARWSRERRALMRDLSAARYWQRAAVAMAEEVLANLKAELFDSTLPKPGLGEIKDWTSRLAAWQRLPGAELVAEYRSWRERDPVLTPALVQAGKNSQLRLQCGLASLIAEWSTSATL